MASAFNDLDTEFFIRVGGNELNSGGFNPWLTGAGTNYANSDTPIINSTTGTCTVGSTTWTDTGVTFPSDLKGNTIRISAKTGGSATALDYFLVMSVTDANNIVLDRSPCASANITAATYRIGGAFAHIKSLSLSSQSGSNNPALSGPLTKATQIWVEEPSGSNNPGTNTYDWSADFWTFTAGGNNVSGNIKFTGFNGRPRIAHRGLLWFVGGFVLVENCFLIQTNGTWLNHAVFDEKTNSLYNCKFDTNGYDSQVINVGDSSNSAGSVVACEVTNSGGGAVGVGWGVKCNHGGMLVYGNWIHGLRGTGVWMTGCYGMLHNNLINANLGDGIKDDELDGSAPIGQIIMHNTIHGNGGHGISLATNGMSNNAILGNLITGHTGSGKYGLNLADPYDVNVNKCRYPVGYNNFYGNTNNFNSISSVPTWTLNQTRHSPFIGDLTLDPGYANSAGNDFTPGVNVINKALVNRKTGSTTYMTNMGGVFT